MNWLLLQSGPCPAAFNMALDEALLEAAPRLGQPVLRFYGWIEPAATFGYFQKFAGVGRATLLRPLIRRPTGGGLVPHDADWTYSLTFPAGHEWHGLRAEASYRRVHEWIQTAFAKLSLETELASCCKEARPRPGSSRREEAQTEASGLKSPGGSDRPSLLTSAAAVEPAGQCFAGYGRFDVLWQGRKMAGAAQRRTRTGLLIQGSIQPPPLPLAKVDWQTAMCDAASAAFGVRWSEFEPDMPLRERAVALAAAKYARAAYNQKR